MYSSITLTTEEIEILTDIAFQFTTTPSKNPELFCKEAKDLSSMVPKRLKQVLMAFAKNGTSSGFFLIEGAPLMFDNEVLSSTPPSNIYRIGETTLLSRIQAIFIHAISEMISYEAEGHGYLFQDVVPTKSMAQEQTSLSSNIELEIHTEQAFSNVKPDILSLACLRGDSNALTHILPVGILLDQLTSEERSFLREPLWKIGVDLSFKMYGQDFKDGYLRGPLPILSGPEYDPTLIFDQDLMFGLTQEANNVIRRIVSIYHKHKLSHCLRAGQIIMVDNRRAVHGRSAFYPKYDGYDRFLIRCFAVFDLERTNYARETDDDNKSCSRMVKAYYS
jgi:L-asparagine oxygenase